MFSHYLAFLGSWIVGILIMFFMLKNKNHSLKPADIIWTLVLSAALSIICSFAAEKANMFHWLTCILFVGGGALVTYKFLDKEHQPKKFFSINPMITIPFLSIWSAGGALVIPALVVVGIVILIISGLRSSKSGSVTGGSSSDPQLHYSNKNVSFSSTWQFKFILIAVAALIGILIWLASDYKGV